MLRAAGWVFVSIWLLSLAAQAASDEKRVALIIGNGAYVNAPTLANPKNDAEDMAAALKRLGFTVILGIDLDKRAMDRKILEFAGALSGAETGVFHYSGHGLQVAGVNYLVPVDAALESAAALDFEAVRLDLIQRTMEREAKTNILFLDACRNNPLARNLSRALGTRSADIGRGLASMESGADTLISFSTQPGNVALDGAGRNSPYSGPLVKTIGTQGEDVLSMLTGVRNAVMAATGSKQVPWDTNALRAKFYFNPAPLASLPPQSPLSEAAQAWAEIKETRDLTVLEAFRKQYGASNALFDTLARQRIEEFRSRTEGHIASVGAGIAPNEASDGSDEVKERALWDVTKDSKNPALIEAFLGRYPHGRFAADALQVQANLQIAGASSQNSNETPITGSEQIKEAQRRLYELNYDPGPDDGSLGKDTNDAILDYKKAAGLKGDGVLTEGLLRHLRLAAPLNPWGAIAYSKSARKWGMSWGMDTRKAAVADAQSGCGAAQSSCTSIFTFFGGECGAFAYSEKRWSLVAREGMNNARRAALEECNKNGAVCEALAGVCANGQEKFVSK